MGVMCFAILDEVKRRAEVGCKNNKILVCADFAGKLIDELNNEVCVLPTIEELTLFGVPVCILWQTEVDIIYNGTKKSTWFVVI